LELVYLWVEDYKNIKKQGFNFSPKFNCHYDEDSNELTINENEDYIENFFGENINVTAIVGKNGSGKSSILELISFLRFERIHQITNKKVIFVFRNKNNLYIICNSTRSLHSFQCEVEITNKTVHKVIKKNVQSDNLFELTMFTNGLYDFTMQDENYYILRTPHFYSFYNGDHVHYKEKKDDKNRHHELNAKYAYLLKDQNDFFNFLDENFLFDKMYLEIDFTRKYELALYDDDEYVGQYKEINNFYNMDFGIESEWSSDGKNKVTQEDKKTELIYKFLSFYFLKEYIHVVSRFEHDFNEKFKENFLKKFLDYIMIPLKIPEVEEGKIVVYLAIITFVKKYFIDLNKFLKQAFKSKKGMLDDFRDNASLLKYVTKYVSIVHILEKYFILKDFESHKNNFYFISESISIDYNLLEKFDKHVEKSSLLTDLYNSNIVRWDFFNQNKNYNYRKLSTGEKQLLEFIVNFAYTIKNMKHTDKSVIFIEEIEISMHPEWQKRLLNIMISVFKKLDLLDHNSLNYNLIFTTHSPFLISDIPKQNIIFLDKDKDGKCKVLPHSEVMNKKQTFGQNIHTLLSDSFFMEDGLMGEFAKEKINEIIEFHKEVEEENKKEKNNLVPLQTRYESDKKRFWQTQSIIGEDYLKQVIKNHLRDIEKILLNHDEAKQEEIKRLRKEADRLENM